MAEVLMPDNRAVRGESTEARVASPIGVARSTTVRVTTTTTAAIRTAAWFSFTLTPMTSKMSGGLLVSPWASKISALENGKRIFVSAGSATQRPTVETKRTSGGAWVSRRKRTAQRNRPSSGHMISTVMAPAVGIDQPSWWLSQ